MQFPIFIYFLHLMKNKHCSHLLSSYNNLQYIQFLLKNGYCVNHTAILKHSLVHFSCFSKSIYFLYHNFASFQKENIYFQNNNKILLLMNQ